MAQSLKFWDSMKPQFFQRLTEFETGRTCLRAIIFRAKLETLDAFKLSFGTPWYLMSELYYCC